MPSFLYMPIKEILTEKERTRHKTVWQTLNRRVNYSQRPSAVARLGAAALTDEATVVDEAVQEGGDAVAGQGLFEGEGDITMGDGFLLGKEFCEACMDLIFFYMERHAVGHLVHFESANLL